MDMAKKSGQLNSDTEILLEYTARKPKTIERPPKNWAIIAAVVAVVLVAVAALTLCGSTGYRRATSTAGGVGDRPLSFYERAVNLLNQYPVIDGYVRDTINN